MNQYGVDSGIGILKMAQTGLFVLRMDNINAKVKAKYVAISNLFLRAMTMDVWVSMGKIVSN